MERKISKKKDYLQFVLGIFAAMKITRNARLIGHNTMGIDAMADCIVEWASADELIPLLDELERPMLAIGQGSNLVFMDDFHGTVLVSAVRDIELLGQDDSSVLVKVGSGFVWDDFVTYAVLNGWWGVENLTAIPGQVGAAAVQNIGAYGQESSDCIETVMAISLEDGSRREFSRDECRYAYRQSIFKNELKGKYAISHVIFRLGLKPAPKLSYGNLSQKVEALGGATLANISRAVREIRAEKLPDPAILGNAGSFFMNPVIPAEQYKSLLAQYPDMPSYTTQSGMVKVPAGWLIEHAGWKGRSLGPAAVYEKQALVLVNTGGATGQDIMALANAITASVKEKYGITLNPEANLI